MEGLLNSALKLGLVCLGAALILGALASGNAYAQDGKTLFVQKGCIACHGAEGKAPIQPTYAKLAGQQAAYIVVQLKAFKAQKRTSGQSALMWGMAAQLSDSDMEKIAKYLQGVK